MITKQGHRHTKEPIPLPSDNRSSLSRVFPMVIARFPTGSPVSHVLQYLTNAGLDPDKIDLVQMESDYRQMTADRAKM